MEAPRRHRVAAYVETVWLASVAPRGGLAEAERVSVPPWASSGTGEACSAPFWPNLGGPCFRHRWLPARLEWTEAAESDGGPRCTEHECNIPAPGFALRLQLPAGRAPEQWPEAFEGSQAFDWHFKRGDGEGGEIVLNDPADSFAETIFLCRTADARKALGINRYTFLQIGWNVN